MMQLENPYLLSPLRLIAIAAAGPAANLLMILSGAALCHWKFLPPTTSLEFIRINAALMLFNLFPALPLDGGRILWALLSVRFSRKRALDIAVLGGRILACALILLSLSGFIAHGQLNLSMPIAAVFLLVSGQDERIALRNSRADALLSSLRPLSHPETAELIAVDTSTPPREALLSARTDRRPIFALYRHGRLLRIVDEQTLMDLLTSEKNES